MVQNGVRTLMVVRVHRWARDIDRLAIMQGQATLGSMKIDKGVTAYFRHDKQSLVTFLYRKRLVAALRERDPYPARLQVYSDGRANPMGGHFPINTTTSTIP